MPPPPKSTLFPYTTLFRSNVGMADESNAIRIGAKRIHENTFIAGIHGTTVAGGIGVIIDGKGHLGDRKSTRLNSSHRCISYAVSCLKKKKDLPSHKKQQTV